MRCVDDAFIRYCERRADYVRECRDVQRVSPPDDLHLDEMFGANPLTATWDAYGVGARRVD